MIRFERSPTARMRHFIVLFRKSLYTLNPKKK
jgi:hypothetical protein